MALSEDYNGVGGLIDADSGDVWELYKELHRRTDVQCRIHKVMYSHGNECGYRLAMVT